MKSGKRREKARDMGPDYMVGIDTGGTYTDGVLLHYRSREIIASSKTLTTPEDLTRGITAALDKLALEDPGQVKLVCISSTLATNSIAEGKGRRVFGPQLSCALVIRTLLFERNYPLCGIQDLAMPRFVWLVPLP